MQSDEQLMARLRAGQVDALDAIIDQYSSYVAAIIQRVGHTALNHADLEEAVADVFIALWQNAHRLHNEASLKPYLAAIARNKARDRLRKLKDAACQLDEDILLLSDDHMTIDSSEQAECIREALEAMDQKDKTIFFWHYYFLEKVTDIAAALDMKPSTVKSRLYRGRLQLRHILQERGFDHASDIQPEDFRYDG